MAYNITLSTANTATGGAYVANDSSILSSTYEVASGATYNLAGDLGNYTYVANSAIVSNAGAGTTSYTADSTPIAETITVGTSHAWNITTSTAADTVYGGAGADTITSYGADTVTGNGGNDVFNAVAGSTGTTVGVTITDYTYGNDTLVTDLANFAMSDISSTGNITTSDYNVANISSSISNNYYKASLVDADGNTEDVWFGSNTAAYMDASAVTSSLLMTGADNSVADTIIGGTKADTIYAGAGDVVYGGAGNDTIAMTGNSSVVLEAAGGKDTVTGFSDGLSSTDSTVYLYQNTISQGKISFDGSTAVVGVSGSTSTLTLSDIESSANYAYVMVEDSTGTTYNVAVASNAADGENINVTDANYANIYVGTSNTVLDYSAVSNAVLVDLGNTGSYSDSATYQNIYSVAGSDNNDTLIGAASGSNSLAGGYGDDSLWGGDGSGNDTLTGGDGADTFFYGSGDGKDVISDYVSGEDTIAMITDDVSATRTGSNVTLSFGSTSSNLTIVSASATANTVYTLTDDVTGSTYNAVFANTNADTSLTYNEDVNFYFGSADYNDTITVSGSAEVWLDGSTGSDGTSATYLNIDNIDASTSSGDVVLAGNSLSNSIVGGTGSSSLWGGAGDTSDTLVGGSGSDTFYYGTDEGNDVITSTSSSDKVMLYNISSSDVTDYSLSGTTLTISLSDNTTLTIENYTSTSVTDFETTDGSYTFDYSSKKFVSNS